MLFHERRLLQPLNLAAFHDKAKRNKGKEPAVPSNAASDNIVIDSE
jgi:hypothetical protein